MNKLEVLIIAIVIGVLIVTSALFLYHKNSNRGVEGDVVATETVLTESAEEVKEDVDEIFSDVTRSYFDDAKYLTVEKVVRTTTEYEDGTSDTIYENYLMGDIDLSDPECKVQDYAAAVDKEEVDETMIKEQSFEEAFGFSYEGMSGWQIFEKLLLVSGIEGDFNHMVFDQETYELTGQKLYEMTDSCSVLKKMISDSSKVTVKEQKVMCQTAETAEHITIPECFNAVVQYEDDGKIVTKNIYLGVTVNNWEVE